MTLRSRVLLALTFVLGVVATVSTMVVIVQRSQLIAQLDDQLTSIVRLERPGPLDSGNAGAPPPAPASPVSEFFVARVDVNGIVSETVRGQLVNATPDFSGLDVESAVGRTFVFVPSTDETMSFRVLVDAGPIDDAVTVYAAPTTDIDETVRQLTLLFIGTTLVIALTLGLIAWWVLQLGIAPIVDMTTTAQAIAAGERSQRAPRLQASTEAGQLADALNDMLDQRDEADDRLRRFVSDASHELRTPLTSIRGYLEIYSSGGFRGPGELDDVVRRMQDESSRMSRLVENLLILARHDEGQPLALESVDVSELIRAVAGDFRTTRIGSELHVVTPTDPPLTARADRQRLLQLLVGLVDNALTHAPEAAVTISADREGEDLRIDVADNGPGMTAEVASHVFDRFARGDSARTRSTGGSGLGLAIAKGIAESHGGTLTLQTAPGEGCVFTVRIPGVVGELDGTPYSALTNRTPS